MANKVKFNAKFFDDMLRQGSKPLIRAEVERIALQAGTDYGSATEDGKSRARGSVWTDNAKAMRDNARNNTLIRSLRG